MDFGLSLIGLFVFFVGFYSNFVCLQDVPDVEILQKLSTPAKSTPSLKVFKNGEETTAMYFTGDTTHTRLTGRPLRWGFKMLHLLKIVYRYFDIKVPKSPVLICLAYFMIGFQPVKSSVAFQIKTLKNGLRTSFIDNTHF